jgi:hypothetical protein
MLRALRAALAVLGVLAVNMAAAEDTPAPTAPYSLPWLLRSAVPANVVRLDQTLAFYQDPASGTSGKTAVTSLLATRKLSPRWVAVVRDTWVHNSAPSGGKDPSGGAFSNPLLGISYVRPLAAGWRWTAFLATALPIGGGGGGRPDAGAAAAVAAAIPGRSGMDNALFAVNYWTVIGGVAAARVTPALTLQAEATVLQLTRVRGPAAQDGSRTNFTAGVHAGHFFSPRVSLGGELRLQLWLSDAAPVRKDPAAREQLSLAAGPRLHFKLGPTSWLRPGLSYTRTLDDPMAKKSYDILQLDAPISF